MYAARAPQILKTHISVGVQNIELDVRQSRSSSFVFIGVDFFLL